MVRWRGTARRSARRPWDEAAQLRLREVPGGTGGERRLGARFGQSQPDRPAGEEQDPGTRPGPCRPVAPPVGVILRLHSEKGALRRAPFSTVAESFELGRYPTLEYQASLELVDEPAWMNRLAKSVPALSRPM